MKQILRYKFFIFSAFSLLVFGRFVFAVFGDPYVEWMRIFHAGGTANDTAYGIATFRSGNLREIWNTLNTTAQQDSAPFVTADPAFGSIYVANSVSNGVNDDYRVRKFNSAGQEVTSGWPQTFNSTANLNDFPGDITGDSSGNIYVTGRSDYGSSGGGWNFVTLKYSSSGISLWNTASGVGVFDGGNNDRGSGVTLDLANNVYVGGVVSKGGNAADTYTVIKYNSLGTQIGRCNLAALNRDDSIADTGKTVAVDSAGNIYFLFQHYNGTTYDYGIVKFNSSCAAVAGWNPKIFSGGGFEYASGLAVDSSENVYVTGYQSNGLNFDYQTMKFNSSGVLQWRKVINYGGNDYGFDLALDASGAYVYVSGYSWNGASNQFLTAQYDVNDTRSGDQTAAPPLSSFIYNAAGSDRAYSIARSGENFFVAGLYDSSPTNNDVRIIKYGPSDDVYVVGTTVSSTIAGQIVKYDSAGTFLWTKQFTPPGSNGEARDVTVDSLGNFYVTGYSDASGSRDFRTAKYDSAGNLIAGWGSGGVAIYDSGGFQQDEAYAVAVDSQGYAYVTGITWNTSDVLNQDKFDIITLKYDPTGTRVSSWDKKLVRPNGDYATDVALDSSGDVYVSGYFCSDTLNRLCNSTPEKDWQGRIVKYTSSSSGYTEAWNIPIPPNGDDYFLYGLAVDAEKNVYATGRTGLLDIRTVKYNSSPALQWNALFDSSLEDEAFGLALDVSGIPYVAGYSRATSTPTFDYRTIIYASSTGQITRAMLFDSGSSDIARAITIGAFGNIYVTGSRSPLATPSDITTDFMTIKYGNFSGSGQACGFPVAVSWIDPIITGNQTKIRQIHVYELRAWINNQRQDVGLGIQAWTDSTITANSTKIKAAHLTEMRTAIGSVYVQCGQTPPTWTDNPITPNVIKIKKAHIDEIRSATQNAP